MAENDSPSIEEQVEEMAELQFTDAEIATIVGMPEDDLISAHESNIDRGRLRAEAEVRRAVYQAAKQGSTPAQKQFMDLNARAKRMTKS